MPIKYYSPTTPGRRGMTSQDFDTITTKRPLKSLTTVKKRIAGRNNQGRITTRHKGGGAKKFYRIISYRLPENYVGIIEHIEYDPNRSARIARLRSEEHGYSYIIATSKMKPGLKIESSSQEIPINEGNRMPLKNIPLGSAISCIELQPNKGAQIARSAGNSAQLMGKDNGYVQVRMPSGEIRIINENCFASIGVVGNEQHQNIKIGKAGRNRHKGIRPSVRGVVMNAADHPHGGGDGGRHGIGGGKTHGSAPKTPWGQKTLGYKTRRRKSTEKYIVRSRHQRKRK